VLIVDETVEAPNDAVTAPSPGSLLEGRSRGGNTLYVRREDPRGRELAESDGTLNPLSYEIFHRLLGTAKRTHVLDVGANYGELIIDAPTPQGVRAWAFEPAEQVADCLTKSLRAAGSTAEVVRAAVGATSGVIEFYEDPAWSGTSTASSGQRSADSVVRRAEMVTLSDVLMRADVDKSSDVFVKIDIEGGEAEALRGLAPVTPLLGSLVIQAEIMRAPDDDLAWMISHWVLHLIDERTLIPVPVATIDDLHRLLSTGRFYQLDAVLSTSILESL
jgi:FkbM family methyltransferase